MNQSDAEQMIFRVLENIGDLIGCDKSELSASSVLLGDGAVIDSLTLVNVIVDLEDEIRDQLDRDVSLTDDEAVFAEPSPYSSIGNLAKYIVSVLERVNGR